MFLFEGRIDVPDVCRSRVQKVQRFKRFKGSNGILKKVQNKYIYFILIYIIIYINITIFEYFMTPFEFGF